MEITIRFDNRITVSRHFEYRDESGRAIARGIEQTTVGEKPSKAHYSVHTGSTCHASELSISDAFALVAQLHDAERAAFVAQQAADAVAVAVQS
jgi:hypothetical protein